MILTLFAHPDDEVLAVGATLTRNRNVVVAIPVTGIMSRENASHKDILKLRSECREALKILGVTNKPIFGDFPDNQLDTVPRLKLFKWVERIVNEVNPDTIFTHHSKCANIDHRYVWEAVMIATRSSDRTVFSCEVPSSTGFLRPVSYEPNYYVAISHDELDRKISALNCYSEKREYPHQRSTEYIKSLAIVRGCECGQEMAEAFMLQRRVLK